MASDSVEITEYDAEWPSRFLKLATPMRSALGETALRIDHIGSTAVAGLAAKPIIDVQISVADLDALSAYRVPLERLGYVHRADNPELTKRYFREALGTKRTHIHVRRAGSWAEQFALLFRDYLRAVPSEADRYAAIKRSLAARYRDDRHAYTDGKQPFIWEVMGRADRWSQEVGWSPGPSDA
jgi:GrpB-like predicted nucleotidyltransferase (UPF0157 family)